MSENKHEFNIRKRIKEFDVGEIIALILELVFTLIFLIDAIWFTADKARGLTFLGENNSGIEVAVIIIFYLLALILGFLFIYTFFFKDFEVEKKKAIPREVKNGKIIYLNKNSEEKNDRK